MFRIKKTTSVLLSIAGGFLIVAIAFTPAFAVQCGDKIRTDVKLTSDLNCTGTALFVFAPGTPTITIDLNGHEISGDGTGDGIFIVDGGGVILKGKGRISNFATGLHLASAFNVVIYDLTVESNQTGINVNRSVGVRIFDNTIRAGSNGQVGVAMPTVLHTALYRNKISGFRQVGVVIPTGDPPDVSFPIISENVIRENQTGILIKGLNSDSVIRGNLIVDNELNGIEIGQIVEASCTIEENRVLRNGGHGILLQGGSMTGCLITNNLVQKNELGGISIEGIQRADQGIQVEGNRLSRNGVDVLWDGASNVCWLQNVFGTSSPQVLPQCTTF